MATQPESREPEIPLKVHLKFIDQPIKRKRTKVWNVLSQGDVSLGEVRWYSPWRRYVFYANEGTLYDGACLWELSMFCWNQTAERKRNRMIAKQIHTTA